MAETRDVVERDITVIQCGCGQHKTCDHDWGGWREFDDGGGGEQVCKKCGLGAMAHTLSLDW